MSKIEINKVKNRFLPFSESVAKGLEPEPKITDFTIKKELGSGSFGRVYLVTHNKTKAEYAIKAIDKRDKSNIEEKPYFIREIEVMYKIHHINVVKLYGHFEDNNYIYFIMEYISKGNVYNLIPQDKKKRLSSQIVASLIKDLISAVYFLHNMSPPIIHRDIKPENVLLAEGMVAKLTDFGWSNYMEEDVKRNTVCGTPIYLAPEIIKEEGHDEKVDIWCIGVLLFELITASVPFPGNDFETLKSNILKLKIAWPRDINTDAKNLIMKILKLDPNARISLTDMMSHPFITKYFPNAAQSLIKPDNTIKYTPFIVCKDNPKTFNPNPMENKNSTKQKSIEIKEKKDNTKSGKEIKMSKQKSREPSAKERSKSPKRAPTDNHSPRKDKKNSLNESYKILKEKYESLLKDYNTLKSAEKKEEPVDNEIRTLKNTLKEKEEKVAQLLELIKNNNKESDQETSETEKAESELKMKVDELDKENEALREKVIRYETFIRNQQGEEIEDNIKELRDSMTNKDKFNVACEKLKKKISEESKNNLNEIIKEKEKELEKIKESEKVRREKKRKNLLLLLISMTKL